MKHDIYAEFLDQEKLNETFRKWIEVKWKEVKSNRKIGWNKKPEKLKKYLENDIGFFHNIVANFLHKNALCPPLYSKLQKLLQYYVQINEENLISFAHSLLSRNIRGYRKNKSPISKLDLKEVPKETYKKFIKDFKYNEIYKLFQNIENIEILNTASEHSIFLKIKFTLRKSYLSKDDEDFYIIDNPVVKDKVFKIPIIRSTTWKGVLRRVVRDIAPEQLVVRLFGNEKESEESKQGRLFFYPTFLNGIDLDVITPLERKKKSPAKGPILFEVVPEGSVGEFKLFYIPFDIINDKNRLKKEIKEDWEVLKEAIPKMMLEYGFSAKKTSGYGVVEDEIELWINDKYSKGSFEDFKREMNVIIHSFGGNNG